MENLNYFKMTRKKVETYEPLCEAVKSQSSDGLSVGLHLYGEFQCGMCDTFYSSHGFLRTDNLL